MTKAVRLGLCSVVLLAMALAGCGDDSSDEGDGSDTSGAGTGSTDMPMDDGTDDMMTDDTSTGDTGADPGTTPALPEPPTCDATVPTTATCGGTECPAPGMIAALTCTVPCCVNDQCGTMTAVEGMVGECAASAQEDPNCPPYEGDVMGMAINLPGCCAEGNVCGVISSISMSCITSSMFLADLAPGPACGDDAGDADAGI